MKKNTLSIALFLMIITIESLSQSTIPLILENNSSNSGTKLFQARYMISMGAGFSYTSSGGTMNAQIIDPFISGEAVYNTSQSEPSSQSISTSYKPGTLSGAVEVSQVGSAGYNIPLELPKGVDGFQPQITLSYSSLSGDGFVGKGWNLIGVGAIVRVPTNLYFDNMIDEVDFDTFDRFSLNGQRLIIYAGDYGVYGSEYRLEQDQSIKISYCNPGYFIVKDGKGNTYEYGNSTDSKVTVSSQTLSWHLNKVTNNYNQTIFISYISSDGWAYPVAINYGVSAVEFYYKGRVSPVVNYLAGNVCRLSLILDDIQVKNNGSVLRRYFLNYFKSFEMESPLLKEIVYYGQNNERLNSTLFKYNLTSTVSLSQTLYNNSHEYISYKSKLLNGDFNGDGKADFLCIPNPNNSANWSAWKVYLSNGNDSFAFGFERDPGVNYNNLKDATCIDLNGDGKDDVAYEKTVTSGGNVYSYFYYMLNTGTAFASPVQICSVLREENTGFWDMIFRRNNKFDYTQSFSDFNGDGINDLLIVSGTQWRIYSMNNNTFMSMISGTISTLTNRVSVGDFNGDGKTDVWNFTTTGLSIYSLEGSSLTLIHSTLFPNKNHYFASGDFNGDGKLDLLVYGYYNPNNGISTNYSDWFMLLSTGTSFAEHSIPQQKGNLYADYVRTADFNGDGATDLMVTSLDNSWVGSRYYMSKNNGTNFSAYIINGYPAASHKYNLADFDGDGRTDFICTDGDSSWWIGYQVYRSPGSCKDLLTEIRNGLGHYTKITYVPISHNNASSVYTKGALSAYPLFTFQGPLHVVSGVEANNGIGGTRIMSYSYENAKIHRQGRGFLGFSKVCNKNEATGIVTENNFEVSPTHYIPLLKSSIVRYSTAQNLSTVSNTWTMKLFANSKRFIPYISSTLTTDNLTGYISSTSIAAPDDYGNPTGTSTYFVNNGPVYSQTITYTFDLDNWLVSRPCSLSTTYNQSGESVSKLIVHTYHNGKVKPDLISYYENNSLKWRKNHDHNENGTLYALHQNSQNLGEKSTYYAYDANGINLSGITHPDSITETFGYYLQSGLLNTKTDHWGNTVTYNYDNFGNINSVQKPNGIGVTSNALSWITNNIPDNARYSLTQTMTDGSQTISYLDLLGREIRRGVKNFDGIMVYTQTDYNAKGQAYRVSEPFASYPSLWNTTSFDNYGRIEGTAPYLGASSGYGYSGGITTITSNGRTYTSKITDATGWVKERSDPGGTIVYDYRPDGIVKQIKAPGDIYTTMTYDSQGNQLSLTDPSAGSSSYTYYGAGEIKTQTTPLGTTSYYYHTDGRLNYYSNPAGNYTYTYGTNKLVSGITSPGGVSRSYTYYANGKAHTISETIETGQTNIVTFVYDNLGRVSSKTYTNANNVSRTESYVYNSYGYLDQVLFNGTVVYDVSTMNTRGQTTAASIGGISASWGYNSYGQLTSSAATGVQNYSYSPNATTGNVDSRSNLLRSLSESFYYDNLDRLDYITKDGGTTIDMAYDSKGNLTTKSDAGTLLYDNGKPYQLAHVNPFTANFPTASQTATYTSFGKVNTLAEGSYSASFKYNADSERIKMVLNQNGTPVKTKYYFGSSYEKTIEGSTTTEYIWIGGSPYTAVAAAKIVNNGTPQVWAIFRDHLGTITHLRNGSTTLEYSFDAWGRRRDKDDWSYTLTGEPALFADRGFTGHEHLTEFGLINMNGRLYDPLVGRFLSPDNYVQAPDYTQSFNRYGYCWNNPLRYSDPEGDFLTWSINNGGLSIGINFTPSGVPLGFGINIGWGNGFSIGGYGEVGYRVGGTGLGSGATVSQSLDYNFNNSNWSTTTSEGAYASWGPFNIGGSLSQSYNITSNQWNYSWGVNAGVGIGNERGGFGLNVGYGYSGWSYSIGGFYNPERPKVYKSPISDNYGNQNGECVLRCLEEFSNSYGMDQNDYDYWLDQNNGKLGVHATKVEGLIDNSGVFNSDRIAPQSNINTVVDAFTNDKRVLMGFKTASGGEHAVMVAKLKIWSSGRYRMYFSETSPVRIAPYSTSNLFRIPGAGFWTFYRK